MPTSERATKSATAPDKSLALSALRLLLPLAPAFSVVRLPAAVRCLLRCLCKTPHSVALSPRSRQGYTGQSVRQVPALRVAPHWERAVRKR